MADRTCLGPPLRVKEHVSAGSFESAVPAILGYELAGDNTRLSIESMTSSILVYPAL